ncbi:hypothetical protein AWB68_08527 [Caballeronia choica]|uniref:Uncharacterized protein n=1 Tax=Caballeronia choica TaxID=326476 RepID=A0A158L4I2_9BURK|nr:hypothetical protein AWB68_08527 [Caballeronia choica]
MTPVRSQRVIDLNRAKARVYRSSSTQATIVRPTDSWNTSSRGQVSSPGDSTYSSVAASAKKKAAIAMARSAPFSVSGHNSSVRVVERYMVGSGASRVWTPPAQR